MSGPRDLAYDPVGDDGCFSKAEFLSHPFQRWIDNLNHFKATRTRVLVNTPAVYSAVATAAVGLSETARFVFDRTPGADVLAIRLGYEVADWRFGNVQLTYRIDSDDTAGGGAETGATRTITWRAQDPRGVPPIEWSEILPIRYPATSEIGPAIQWLDWIPHVPHASAAFQGSILKVMGNTSAVFGDEPPVYLRAICVVGLEGG